jgi:spore coat polysaccharide biosynthesis protein SpsF
VKIAILITARLKSTRLPMKAIKPIHNRPMIAHMLDRLKLAQRPDDIIICTSPVAQDNPLEKIAQQEGVLCYRGDPDDVLLRLTKAAKEFGVDTVISCTADNPFVDPGCIDRLADFHLKHHHDYSRTEGLPFGTFTYALSYPAMVRACKIKNETDTEVWGGYFSETGLFSCGVMHVNDRAIRWPELRLTVDMPEDFELIRKIFDELYEPTKVFPLSAIVRLCRKRPDLVQINASVQQKVGRPIKINTEVEQTKIQLY